ncbi:MAG: chemotaxis protein CheY [Peptococcaceae bacterium BRH_c4b]|nr:MAG: chemotaxis protein CheY [Peptococcaceae bacterium BRH_c4b]
MNVISIIIVDDHALVREGIRKILSLEPDIKIIGEAANGEEAITQALSKNPDIILMDINMPGISGVEACQTIKLKIPGTGIIGLTIHDQEEYLIEFIRAGASAYILKDVSPDQLVRTIRDVARGESFIPPKLITKIFKELNRLADSPLGAQRKDGELLTPREVEVLKLLARGETNKTIARALYISEKTVKNHLYRIFQKIEVEDRTQAALYALRNKLVNI